MLETIDIVLAVHNGERFIRELIDSILKQTHTNWNLIIRDEGSTDQTMEIVDGYIKKENGKIRLFHDDTKRGASQNFGKALEFAQANYIMFADCDDIWLPHKIEMTFERMKKMESRYGQEIPLMVFTDLKVVDRQLNLIAPSYLRYQNHNPERGKKLNGLIISNPIAGCTVMLNRVLKEKAMPIPREAIMHDHWVALVAAAFGKIEYIDAATILFRLHGMNDTGAINYDYSYVMRKIKKYLKDDKFLLEKEQEQAKAFYGRYRNVLKEDFAEMTKEFLLLRKGNHFYNKYLIIKNRFYKSGVGRNVGLLLKI